jgi:hypothetical protein
MIQFNQFLRKYRGFPVIADNPSRCYKHLFKMYWSRKKNYKFRYMIRPQYCVTSLPWFLFTTVYCGVTTRRRYNRSETKYLTCSWSQLRSFRALYRHQLKARFAISDTIRFTGIIHVIIHCCRAGPAQVFKQTGEI